MMDRWLLLGFNRKECVVDGVVLNFWVGVVEIVEIVDDEDEDEVKDDLNIGIVGTEPTDKDDYEG